MAQETVKRCDDLTKAQRRRLAIQLMLRSLAVAAFLFIAYYAITYFFGLYIYEMPNHKCPYCMLQKEYYYIGYLIWGSLFLGIFFGIMPFLIERITKKSYAYLLKYSSICLIITAIVCSFYVVRYYLMTGVLL